MAIDTSAPYAAPPLKCDIVMKGGITSGVIYPRAVAELARTYRLSNVGGASAGAIAAAAAAAAEYGRDSGGFDELDAMPDELAALGPDGQSRLASFFQPTAKAAPLFRMLFGVAGSQDKRAALVGGALRGFWPAATVGALPGLVVMVLSALGEGIAAVAGIVAGAALLVVGVVFAILVSALRRLAGVAEDGFGMCTGMPGARAGDAPALTPWLHGKIQSLAGRTTGDDPLTFGDLTRAGITLRMMTTDLTRHKPVAMPWGTREFFFDPDEMRAVFPSDVVDWMVAHPPPGADDDAPPGSLRPWPAADDLPVIVATRMSLSFPGLISAVRLWAVDRTDPANRRRSGAPSHSPVWFTDGGLCANLPVHFFDSPLPRHPTFALNLGPFPPGVEKSGDQSENSYLPTTNRGGRQRPWHHLPTRGLGAWAAFGAVMVHTAREWVDGAQMVMPGYRDRILTVHHDAAEGGMNLAMPPQVVRDLAERGRLGAAKLVRAFAGDRPGVDSTPGWDNHRWIRFRTSMSGLDRWTQAFDRSYGTLGFGTPYSRFAGPGADGELPSFPLTPDQRAVLNDRTGELIRLAGTWNNHRWGARDPQPPLQLRLVPDDGTAAGLDILDEAPSAL